MINLALLALTISTTINGLPLSSGLERQSSSFLEGRKPPPRPHSPLRSIWKGMTGRQKAITAITASIFSAATAVGVAGAGVAIDNSIKQRKGYQVGMTPRSPPLQTIPIIPSNNFSSLNLPL